MVMWGFAAASRVSEFFICYLILSMVMILELFIFGIIGIIF